MLDKAKADEGPARDKADLTRAIPALGAYLERVGAVQVSIRKFAVIESDANGYPRHVADVKLSAEGELTFKGDDRFAPTEEEVALVKLSSKDVNIPKSIAASESQARSKARELGGTVYTCWNRQGEPVMLQHLFVDDKGNKQYIPWTYWSDGEWRALEPDGPLPFWKPKDDTYKRWIMVHEGAKAAEAASEIKADHPWAGYLGLFEHWGLMGGALRGPNDADYDEIRNLNVDRVVYVCDNDQPGCEALVSVSKHYRGAMFGVKFPANFPLGWDIADDLPDHLFEKGVYKTTSPQLQDLLIPATWATSIRKVEGGKPKVGLRKEFARQWIHCVLPEVYIHEEWPSIHWSRDEFNHKVQPFSDVDDTARLLRKVEAQSVDFLKYKPGDPEGVSSDDRTRFFNTYQKPLIVPAATIVRDEAHPISDFLQKLVPNPTDRNHLAKWCATLVGRPDIHMTYAVLAVSETQGVGKGTLAEKVLAPLVGWPNVSAPSEAKVVGDYNDWLVHRRLIIIHEIYAGHSSAAYDKLKSYITEKRTDANKKFQHGYTIENYAQIFACSNSVAPLRLAIHDRRWLVPDVTEEKQPPQYWQDLNRWLVSERGLEISFRYFLRYLDLAGPVMEGADAPSTDRKNQMMHEGMSRGQAMMYDKLMEINDWLKGDDDKCREMRERSKAGGFFHDGAVFVLDTELIEMVKEGLYQGRHSDKLERPLTARKTAKVAGWVIGKKLDFRNPWGAPRGSCIIASSAKLASLGPADLSVKPLPLVRRGGGPDYGPGF